MGRKVWSSLLIGIALGIFITGTLYTYVFEGEEPNNQNRDAQESKGEGTSEEEEREGDSLSNESDSLSNESNSQEVLEIEIEENHSMENLVYDLMVEGVISSKHQQQQIYEVLSSQSIDPGLRKIPLYASTEEIIRAIIHP